MAGFWNFCLSNTLYFSLFLKNIFIFIFRGHYIPRPGLKSFARKSTGTALKSFSYYRMAVEPLDLSSISTRMSISGMEITLNATKMAEIINLNPSLKIKKCKQTSWVSTKLNWNSPSSTFAVVSSSRVFIIKMPKRKMVNLAPVVYYFKGFTNQTCVD